jgi:hypothetical protein
MKRITVELSPEAVKIIDKLLAQGIFGKTPEEICERFIDAKLIEISCGDNERQSSSGWTSHSWRA